MTDPATIPPAERTLDLALDLFDLVTGTQGDEHDGRACGASLLSWVHGDRFSDRLDCAHPTLNSLMISAFDHPDTTDDEQIELVKAGMGGMLDTWHVPGVVVAAAQAHVTDEDKDRTVARRVIDTFGAVAFWKAGPPQRPNLTRANLTRAYLARANLTGANLTGADLTYANLAGTNLTGTNLARANLTGANLTGANLTGAYLADANLTDADLGDWERGPSGFAQRKAQ